MSKRRRARRNPNIARVVKKHAVATALIGGGAYLLYKHMQTPHAGVQAATTAGSATAASIVTGAL